MLSTNGKPGIDLPPREPNTRKEPYFGPNNWLMSPLSPAALAIIGTCRHVESKSCKIKYKTNTKS